MNLIQLREKAQEKKHIENRLKKVKLELSDENEKLSRLTGQLKKEYNDVQRLKEGGVTAMFFDILGSKEKKLDKERQEYLAAKLKYDNCKKEIVELKSEYEQLQKELESFGSPELDYNKLLIEKKSGLMVIGDKEFLKYVGLLKTLFTQKTEVNEAIEAGERAIQGLNYAIAYLKKAKGWGTVDMLGGGLVSTAIKRSNMDNAKEFIHDVQIWLRKFARELSDVKIQEFPEMNIQLDTFMSFADYFFDNLIFDWVVQSKINRSLEGCEQTNAQVARIISQLKKTNKNLSEEYNSTKADFTAYIELT